MDLFNPSDFSVSAGMFLGSELTRAPENQLATIDGHYDMTSSAHHPRATGDAFELVSAIHSGLDPTEWASDPMELSANVSAAYWPEGMSTQIVRQTLAFHEEEDLY